MSSFFDSSENIANTFSDLDANWWPFLFLRPRRHERMGELRLGLLSALYGGFFGTATNVIVAVTHRPAPLGHAWLTPVALAAALFVIARVTLAWAWNRRAVRLARGESWKVASARVQPPVRLVAAEDAEVEVERSEDIER